MKIYISADIEGITGVTHVDEASKAKTDYTEFQEQMTAEVNAACLGAIKAGAKEIYIKDAHSTGRNIIAHRLPECVKLIRGWSGHPFGMLQDLDETFDAVIMIGYHSKAGSEGSPLSHTYNDNIFTLKINGKVASEFLLNAYTAAWVGVPVVFVSGDEDICEEVKVFKKGIKTVAVKKGIGSSTISIHPNLAVKEIKEGVNEILTRKLSSFKINIPDLFIVEVEYRSHLFAQKASFFPDVNRTGSRSILFKRKDYFEVLRTFMYVV